MQATTLNPNPPPSNAPAAPLGLASGQAPPAAPALSQQKPRRRVLTSLTLQIFIFFGGWWSLIFYVLNILVYVYKGLALPYPETNYGAEFATAFVWGLIEIPRLFLASKGNKTEKVGPLIFSLILALPIIGMLVYDIGFQTYVLKADILLDAITLVFIGLQLLFSLWAIIIFFSASRFS